MAENTSHKKPSESLVPKRTKKAAPAASKASSSSAPARSAPANGASRSTSRSAPETTSRKSKAAPAETPKAATEKRPAFDENSLILALLPYLLGFVGLFFAACIGFPQSMGLFGKLAYGLRMLLSYAAWAIPVFLFFSAFRLREDILRCRVLQKLGFSVICTLALSVIVGLLFIAKEPVTATGVFEASYREAAKAFGNGGVIGGLLGSAFNKIFGKGAIAIAVFIVLLFGFFQFGLTPEDIALFIRDKIRERYHDIRTRQKAPLHADRPASAENGERRPATYKPNRDMAYALTKKNIDIDISDRRPRKQSFFDRVDEEESGKTPKYVKPARFDEPDLSVVTPPMEREDTENVPTENTAGEALPNEEVTGVKDAVIAPEKKKTATVEVGDDTADDSTTVPVTDLDSIFADNAVIASAGMSVNASALGADMTGTDMTVEPTDGVEVVSEVSDTEKSEPEVGLAVQSGKLVVEAHPSLEELYSYPSYDLLKKDPNPLTFTVTEELTARAVKLVETLSNFGVKTKITNISCGPTVTRYELQPEVGVRVKSIQNLSDDIALHLAASGVRIEAPIPGKDAVGIEIPNQTVSTVYIRDLLENDKFRSLKSRISVCLGMDVAGSPVYMDIAKMPHLLIAGATGMGKSVCINSFIISILYKARPDEVKFILIDPKKVEFSLYKSIPHLLVPVVTEPKKAAGALSWAVNEMERRFMLIEEVGVRDLFGYNEATKNDPERPRLSQIVIIIDELADLMMTARDAVETSICRLAQKGRAAGMHIVIGTQRPSVDVITGLIKANVPSRIACTVASQVDSRTIIDISGAEKLLGKGDMLFAPVGCMKPIRVQGAFVSDAEVEAVTDFLRSNGEAQYDSSVIADIEREAAKCGEKKKGKGGDDGGDADDGGSMQDNLITSDDMILPAIQVALSAGQLSTSLLQRKLSLGYARASRIVDILEQLHFVSGFEGSKPRRVLITEQQFDELRMRLNDEGSDE